MHPLPVSLDKECKKATKILRSFVDSSRNGLDGIIPRQILAQARGFVILTVVKAGFLFSARAGSGIVIARLDDGSWSAPSAIGTAGMGVGGQAGAEMTEFLIVLNSRAALRTFMSAGSLQIGANGSVALGPLGRNGELSGALNSKGKVAAMYSYSKTKGLFGGISLEGSVIVERQEANCLAYRDDTITAKMLLSGYIDPPAFASALIAALDDVTGGIKGWVNDSTERTSTYAFEGIGSPSAENPSPAVVEDVPTFKKKSSFPSPSLWGKNKRSNQGVDSYFPQSSTTPRLEDPFAPHLVADSHANSSGSNGLLSAVPDKTQTQTSNPRFSTHFDSDFDPTTPPPVTHRRQLSSAYAPSTTFNDLIDVQSNTLSAQPVTHDIFDAQRHDGYRDSPTSSHFHSPTQSQFSSSNRYSFSNTASYAPTTPTLSSHSPTSASFTSSPNSPFSPSHSHSNSYSHSHSNPYSHSHSSSLGSMGAMDLSNPMRKLSIKRGLKDPLPPGVVRGIAMFDYRAQQAGDLSFQKGEVIHITKKSDSADDWWTGRIDSREGIFPANFVEVV